MSQPVSIADQKYTNLCTQLGNLVARREIIDVQVKELIASIKAVNEVSGDIKALEAQLAKALAPKDAQTVPNSEAQS